MKITGVDIRKQEFPRKFRGYDTLDVNAFLQFVADAVDQQHAKGEELEERCAELSRRVEETERRGKLLEESLKAVNDMREEVKDRAEGLLESARAESEKLRNQAEEDAARLRQEAEWNSRRLREEVSSLEKLRDKSLLDLAELIRSHGRLLESEANRLGVELPGFSAAGGGKVVPINKKAEGEGK